MDDEFQQIAAPSTTIDRTEAQHWPVYGDAAFCGVGVGECSVNEPKFLIDVSDRFGNLSRANALCFQSRKESAVFGEKEMPSIADALKSEIRRLARKEAQAEVKIARKLIAQHRRDIAALKQQVAEGAKTLAILQRAGGSTAEASRPASDGGDGVRFSSRSVLSQRQRLGLTHEQFARLVGVSATTVYLWETKRPRPRESQLAKFAVVRGLGRKEALARLAVAGDTKMAPMRGDARSQQLVDAVLADTNSGDASISALTILAERKRLQLSREQFGQLLGVTYKAVYYWESGMAKPRAPQRRAFFALKAIDHKQALARVGLER